ncbi:hypothetical protein MK489_18875 [Myxococcota bacterium]|nr:hypothetical protein [Myxococcota bacterium]
MSSSLGDPGQTAHASCARRHLVFGWWSLVVFIGLGTVLEAMHGLKIGWYLDVSNETRRLMWTLAHAHGTLLSLVHIAFAFSLSQAVNWSASSRDRASKCLTWSTYALPGGFFLGGFWIYDGDPGLGVFLAPIGGLLLLVGVLLVAIGVQQGGVKD